MTNRAPCLLNRTSLIRSGPVRCLVVGGTLLIAAIVIGATLTVQNFRERALHHRERETENTVQLMAFHLDQHMRHLAVVQRDQIRHIRSNGITTVDGYKTSLSSQDTHQLLRSKMDTLPYVGGLNVFDADGNLINTSTAWPAPKVNIADRTHFQTFRSDPRSPDMLIEPIVDRLSGKWTIILAHRVTGPNGEFLGVVGQSIDPVHFEEFFATVVLGSGAAIAMFSRDGALLARYPHVDGVVGKNFKTERPAFKESVLEHNRHSGRQPRPVNGEDSLLSSRRLENFPIVLVATTAISEALTDWRKQTCSLVVIAVTSALAIAVLLIAVVRKLSEQHRTWRERLTLEMQRLDRAINNMTQGLVLFDSSAQLVTCNQRYIEMFELSPEVVKPGCSFHEITEHRRAIASTTTEIGKYIKQMLRDGHERGSTIIETFDGRAIQVIGEPLADGGWLVTHEDITERRRIEERITHLAHYDALTDLPNRATFQEHLRQKLDSIADGEQVAVHYINVDEFKSANDALGHLVGDELLKSIAASLSRCVGEGDFVARLGGDEFAIVQSHVTSTERITDLVARVFNALREPFDYMGHQLTADVSIGIALAPQHGIAPDQILKSADLAMYAAKSAGRRTYRFFEPEMDANSILATPRARMLADYLLSLEREVAASTSGDVTADAQATTAMIATCLSPSPDRIKEEAETPGLWLNRTRAGRYIEKHLGNPALTPARICREVGVSRSVLYRVFEAAGGVMQYIRRARLHAAHKLLTDDKDTRRVGEIAVAVGFTDASDFSRAFSREFGYSPSDARAATS